MHTEFLKENDWLPFTAVTRGARGLWWCIPHLVHDHPIFEGLASGKMMDDLYENVWAMNTLGNLEGEELSGSDPVVASIGYNLRSGDSWWGSDVAVLTMGKGNIIVSQLRLLNQLAKDPVADRILYNIINYNAKL